MLPHYAHAPPIIICRGCHSLSLALADDGADRLLIASFPYVRSLIFRSVSYNAIATRGQARAGSAAHSRFLLLGVQCLKGRHDAVWWTAHAAEAAILSAATHVLNGSVPATTWESNGIESHVGPMPATVGVQPAARAMGSTTALLDDAMATFRPDADGEPRSIICAACPSSPARFAANPACLATPARPHMAMGSRMV